MMRIYKIAFIACMIVLTSCNKNEFDGQLDLNEYLIFGTFAFECGGNCVVLYKLEDENLYEDDLDWGLPADIPFMTDALDSSKYEIAQVLIDAFPDDLLKSSKRIYGCPDCADQGGIYIELNDGGERNIWQIDTYDSEQSQAIIDYKNKLRDVMRKL